MRPRWKLRKFDVVGKDSEYLGTEMEGRHGNVTNLNDVWHVTVFCWTGTKPDTAVLRVYNPTPNSQTA